MAVMTVNVEAVSKVAITPFSTKIISFFSFFLSIC
jgi:hypothetical protein